jgi:hypothetical protein
VQQRTAPVRGLLLVPMSRKFMSHHISCIVILYPPSREAIAGGAAHRSRDDRVQKARLR